VAPLAPGGGTVAQVTVGHEEMRSKLKRSDIVAVLIGLCAIAFAWAFDTGGCGCSDADYLVQTLEVDASRRVRVTAASCWEISQPLCSEILDGNEVVSAPCHIGCIGDSTSTSDLHFALLMSNDHDIIALVEESSPDVVLMLHRFSTGENYPRDWRLPSGEYDARMDATLDCLRRSLRREGLVLSGQARGSVDRKVK